MKNPWSLVWVTALFAAAFVTACGGGGGGDAGTSVSVAGTTLSVQVTPYINAMPSVVMPGAPSCSWPLIIPGEFSAEPVSFSGGVSVSTVTLYDAGGVIWSGSVEQSELWSDQKGIHHVVARGCLADALREGQLVWAVYGLHYQGATIYLMAPPVKLFWAF